MLVLEGKEHLDRYAARIINRELKGVAVGIIDREFSIHLIGTDDEHKWTTISPEYTLEDLTTAIQEFESERENEYIVLHLNLPKEELTDEWLQQIQSICMSDFMVTVLNPVISYKEYHL